MESTIITLSNGLRVANLNSPHDFIFEDGSILPAVSNEFALATQLENEDVEVFNGSFTVVEKRFKISAACYAAIDALNLGDVCDVIIAPLPVVMLGKELGWYQFSSCKVYGCYLVDRIKKTVSINKFCR